MVKCNIFYIFATFFHLKLLQKIKIWVFGVIFGVIFGVVFSVVFSLVLSDVLVLGCLIKFANRYLLLS